MSSTILKLMDETEEVVRNLCSAIDEERRTKTIIQYEKLLILEKILKSIFQVKFLQAILLYIDIFSSIH